MASFSELRKLSRFLLSFIVVIFLFSWMYIEDISTRITDGINDANNENVLNLRSLNLNFYPNRIKKLLSIKEDRTVRKTSIKKIKILCWILTMPANHDKKAIHVKNTWGKRCNKLIFMSSQNNDTLPSVDLGIPEGRGYLWGKTKKAFQYVYAHHLKDYDWFMKADDDTYVILENLRYLLSIYDTDEDSIYFGRRFKKFSNTTFMSGGGGYVLSRKALRTFIEVALPNPALCKQSDIAEAEDVEMGTCLNNTGVISGDSRDSKGQGKFFPSTPANHVASGELEPLNRYWNVVYYPFGNGSQCCSDLAISFHYIDPKKMHELEYLIYRLHPFGIQYDDNFPPPPPLDKNSTPPRILGLL